MAEQSKHFPGLKSHVEQWGGEMTDEQRHVELGICWATYTAGSITLDEFNELQALLGFSDGDIDDLLF